MVIKNMDAKHPLEAYRESNGLTQDQLAEKLGVTGASVSRWEQRKRAPRGRDLEKIVTLTGIPAGEILGVLSEAAE